MYCRTTSTNVPLASTGVQTRSTLVEPSTSFNVLPGSISSLPKLATDGRSTNLNDVKSQLQTVKALSPQKPLRTPVPVSINLSNVPQPEYQLRPSSPAPTFSALANLKKQLHTLKEKNATLS